MIQIIKKKKDHLKKISVFYMIKIKIKYNKISYFIVKQMYIYN